jgi:CheY-like chemotaxis protein
LSTVANIVKRHRGFIEIDTQPGKGTEFKVFLPAVAGSETTEVESQEPVMPAGHGELILVIDDESAVREVTKTMLETYGYRVILAQDGLQGIERFKEAQGEIRLLITDTDMPYLDGISAICAIKEVNPTLPVILASASKHDTDQLRRADIKCLKRLEKPFRLDQLLVAIEALLTACDGKKSRKTSEAACLREVEETI